MIAVRRRLSRGNRPARGDGDADVNARPKLAANSNTAAGLAFTNSGLRRGGRA